jgi:hypothetical protein
MASTAPGITDIKVLFARSGNRCAFPKCKAPIVDAETLLGEVAHIKGAKLGSPRYDPAQSPEERHAYPNLILLCPNHHTVVDNDEEAYTVDRLQRMKVVHEVMNQPLSETEAAHAAPLFIDNSVMSVGQSGGVTAGTVVLPQSDPIIQTRRLQAVEKIWQILQAMRGEFTDAVFLDQVLVPNEIDERIKSGQFEPPFASINNYRRADIVAHKFINAKTKDATSERPFVSPRVWGILYVLNGLYGRSGLLLSLSFKEGKYKNWRDDAPLDHLLRAVLPSVTVDQAKAKLFGGLHDLIEQLEHRFLQEAGMSKD